MASNVSSVKKNLLKPTPLGLKLWVVIIASILLLSIILLLIFLCRCLIHYRKRKSYKSHLCFPITVASKDRHNAYSTSSLDSRLLPLNISEIEMNRKLTEHRPVLSDQLFTQASGRSCQNGMVTDVESMGKYSPVVRDVWRGSRFSLMEIEVATNGFAKENLIGNEDNESVYRGILLDSTRVAVKRLESNRYINIHFIEFILDGMRSYFICLMNRSFSMS